MLSTPISLYIHLPWCIRKCPYCDFNSHAISGELPEKTYIDALLKDWAHDKQWLQQRRLQTIFIGGGTPSLFSPASIQYLLEKIQEDNSCVPNIEITMEANPGTFEIERFAQFRAAGVTRLSLGIQSFNNDHLKALGRVHGASEAHLAAQHAREIGFDNFNLDLMYALPKQSPSEALADLQTAIDYAPTHISWYQLTLEPNTKFWLQPPALPPDDTIVSIENLGRDLLQKNNYQRYEVSAFAKDNFQCLHNLNYWEFGDYIGIGAGAHGKITLADKGEIMRYWKLRSPSRYLSATDFIAEKNILNPADRRFEFMLNALRLIAGCDTKLYFERTGLDMNSIEKIVAQLVAKDLLVNTPQRLVATELGQRFLNDVLQGFLPGK